MSYNGWKEVKLGDISKIRGGKRLPKGVNLLKEKNSHPYIRVRDLGNKNLCLNGNFEYVDNETQEKISRYIVNTGDIVISIVGTIGLISKIDKSLNTANLTENCVKLVDLINVNSDYLYYYLLSEKGQYEIQKGTVGAVQAKLPIKNIQAINVILPSMEEQKAIATTLSCLDDKIEINNRINKNLEEMAQAIFKSWFVDFEPFQDGEFEDSELGRIPKGWRVGPLEECIELFDSKRIPLSTKQRKSMRKIYPYYGAASLIDYVEDFIFDGVYVLLGEDGTVVDGKGFPILQYVWGKFWVNNHAHVLKGKRGFNEASLYILLKNTSVQGLVTGAVQPKISQANLKSLKVLIPTHEKLSEYNNLVASIFAEKMRGYEENQTLASIRDTLLPKLMSGEIRVPIEEVQ